jgi:hypothetical protein
MIDEQDLPGLRESLERAPRLKAILKRLLER